MDALIFLCALVGQLIGGDDVRIGAMIRNVHETNVHVSIFPQYKVQLLEVQVVHDQAAVVLPVVALPLEHPAGIDGVHQELRCRENGERIDAHLVGQIDGVRGGLDLADPLQRVPADGLTPVAAGCQTCAMAMKRGAPGAGRTRTHTIRVGRGRGHEQWAHGESARRGKKGLAIDGYYVKLPLVQKRGWRAHTHTVGSVRY